MEHFADRLLNQIARKGAPICVGIDPVFERLPEELRKDQSPVKAIYDYSRRVLKAVEEHVPVVKFQSACFERYFGDGISCLRKLIAHARDMNLIVILDAKRGDIGTSAAHYAQACLADTDLAIGPDALTVNAYLGEDSLGPFVDVCIKEGKGIFPLIRTSNPGGDALQSLELKDGISVSQAVGRMVAQLGSSLSYVGEYGYSFIGGVVGATKSQDMAELRSIMPQQMFLVPGFGAQGGSAEDVGPCFKSDGTGAIITASRSIIYAYEQNTEADWTDAVAKAAIKMKNQIAMVLNAPPK